MPTTDTVNTQQVLQMGSHAEKLQQTLQNQPLTAAQQLEEERKEADEIKRSEVQDMEDMDPAVPVHPDKGRRKRVRVRKKKATGDDKSETTSPRFDTIEESNGKQINLTV